MSTSGHWFDPESAEQYLKAVDALQAHTSAAYDQIIKQDLSQIETQLNTLADSDQKLETETRRQLQEVVGIVGRFKRQTASALLELEQEIKNIHKAMAQAIEKESDLERQQLDIERKKLRLEGWKLAVALATALLTGLLFPVILKLTGITP